MKIGANMISIRADAVSGMARTAEELGYESVFVPDHLIFPETVTSRYPFSPDGVFTFPTNIPLIDPWVLLSHVAASTSTIKLGTAVYVLPLRNVLVTARAVASLDVLSGGRVLMGVGLGWLSDEFDAAGEDFASRGARAEEIIAALRQLWKDETPEFHGDSVDFGRVKFEPKPPGGRVPIVIGGDTPAAMRRAARIGDGWMSANLDIDGVARAVALIREERDRLEATNPFEITAIHNGMLTPAEVDRYADAGVDRVVVTAWAKTSQVVPALERIAQDVLSRL